MKKISLLALLCSFVATASAQSWVSNASTKKLFTSPDTTMVGIGISNPTARLHIDKGALKIGNSPAPADRAINMLKIGDGSFIQIGEWEADDMLSFKANKYNFNNGNVGIGVSSPQYKLDVNGKLYLRATEHGDRWARSFLQWENHILTMGVPAGQYGHTIVQIMPGGSSEGQLYSCLSLYMAYSETNKEETVRFSSEWNSWINTSANFGLGTNDPQYKLDVRGTIRATEILVNTPSGADFVFEGNYKLRPLQEVKSYVQENHHLPEIPSAKEMQEEGMSVNEMVVKLLQKVEELTLYNIQLEERISKLEKDH